MKRGLFYSALCAHLALFSHEISTEFLDKEEAFMLRRITEFWKDRDYSLVQRQIDLFLTKYPESILKDYLNGILGDLHLKNRDFEKAIETYSMIVDVEIQQKVFLNKLQAMFELNQFEELYCLGEEHLVKAEQFQDRKDEFLFLMAESSFRHASQVEEKAEKPLLHKARTIYEKLLKSNYSDPAQFALAELYKQINEPKQSAILFKKLAEKYTDKAEELLFNAAIAESLYDPKTAIETFSDVISLEGIRQNESTFNRLVLLFQQEDYPSVIQSIESLQAQAEAEAEAESQPLILYMYARALFAMNSYEKALQTISEIEENSLLDPSQIKNLYLIELGCSQQLQQIDRYTTTLNKLEASFPSDKETPKAIFIHALMLKEKLQLQEAQQELERVLQLFPHFENSESLLLEYGFVTYDNENYGHARSTLKQFLEQFPTSEQISSAWRYYLSATLQLYDVSQKQTQTAQEFSYKELYTDLQWILTQGKGLSSKEVQECRFLQAKVGLELNLTEESLQKLLTYVHDYKEHSSTADAHFLIAIAYSNLPNSYKKFLEHSKTAITLAKTYDHISLMHLQFFNAFLRYKEAFEHDPLLESKTLTQIKEKAAWHLYEAFVKQDVEIKQENLFWLASVFYDQSPLVSVYGAVNLEMSELATPLAKAKQILEKLLVKPQDSFLSLLESNPRIEWAMMRLIQITGEEGNLEQKQALLTTLLKGYAESTKTYELQQEALIEMAKCYELNGESEKALEAFQQAVKIAPNERNLASEYAKIHTIRLEIPHFGTFSPEEIEERLNYLKGLQIQKEVASEPLHLEASLVYVDARTFLCAEEDREAQNRFFLTRVQEDYTDLKNLQLVDYMAHLGKNPKAKKLYDSYMRLISLELNALDGKRNLTAELEETHYIKGKLQLLNETEEEEAIDEKD